MHIDRESMRIYGFGDSLCDFLVWLGVEWLLRAEMKPWFWFDRCLSWGLFSHFYQPFSDPPSKTCHVAWQHSLQMRSTEGDQTCKCNCHQFACFASWSNDSTLPEDVFIMFFYVFLASDCPGDPDSALAPTEVADSLSAALSVWFLFHCSNLVELMDRR